MCRNGIFGNEPSILEDNFSKALFVIGQNHVEGSSLVAIVIKYFDFHCFVFLAKPEINSSNGIPQNPIDACQYLFI
jgi:hypothetical protein